MANTGDPESVAAAQPTDPADPTPDTVSPAWCIVANIVGEHAYGPGGVQTRVGTRKLRAGSKVFVVGSFSGMGSETVTVVGRLRYTNRYITISIAAKYRTAADYALLAGEAELLLGPAYDEQCSSNPRSRRAPGPACATAFS